MFISLAIALPFIIAALIPLIYKYIRQWHLGWFVLAVPVALFMFFIRFIQPVATGKVFTSTYAWIPSFNINFVTYLDGLSLIFVLLITGVGSLVTLYSIFYLSEKESLHHFYCYLLLFMGAMLGVVLSDNLMVLYAFWELTSVSSFLLIAFWHHRKASRAGARKAMVITVLGGISMLAGFLMLAQMANSFSVREIATMTLTNEALFIPAMLCILLGAFTKSAQFPFHIWLPDAMEAPTPVSAYLHSATMVKAGIYLVARLSPVFGGSAVWFWVITVIGLITLFWGSFNAVRQTDLKALLAYSTVSQLGLIMSLFGVGSMAYYFGYADEHLIYTQATFAALFHLINHSTFKGALFMMVGIVDHEVGTRDIRRLGGLMAMMPVTFTIAMAGSLSMAGSPPFNGFLSKEMFFSAMLTIKNADVFALSSIGILLPVIAWVASVFTFIYSVILVTKTFFGKFKPERLDKRPHEAPFGMLISPLILSLSMLLIFFFPNVLAQYILSPAMRSMYREAPIEKIVPHITPWHFNTELMMTVGVILIGLLLYKYLPKWRRVYQIFTRERSFNALYDASIQKAEQWSDHVTMRYMTGNLTHYFMYIYVCFVTLVSGYFIIAGTFSYDATINAPIANYEWIMVFVIIFAAFYILFAKQRMTAVLLNSVIGYVIAFLFVVFRAPDLALTQLVVESITTVLFLVCFRYLPDLQAGKKRSKRARKWHGLIAIATGATVTMIGLAVLNYDKFAPISSYFDDALNLAGGANIVNTILGDFRAFDTMLEVVVLFIAGLGVYTLTKLKPKKGAAKDENQ